MLRWRSAEDVLALFEDDERFLDFLGELHEQELDERLRAMIERGMERANQLPHLSNDRSRR